MAHELFDIEIVHNNFEASLKDPADVLMDQYLAGFKELYKYIENESRFNFVFLFFYFSKPIFVSQIFPTDGLRIWFRQQ